MSESTKSGSNRQTLLAVVAVALLIVAAIIVAKQTASKPPSNMVWYYDVADGTLFPGPPDQILPIDAPSGPEHGVLAHVYACGKCTPTTRKVIYLESNTPEAKQILLNMPDPADPEVDASPYMIKAQEGALIAQTPAPGEQPQWFNALHPDAEILRTAVRNLCPNARPKHCTP